MKMGPSDNDCLAQLAIHTGKRTRQSVALNQFPVLIGRSGDCHLRLEDMGVWDRHAQIDLDRPAGFVLRPASEASTMVNGEPLGESRRLRNGDLIDVGMVRLQFWLGPVRQKRLAVREVIFWLLIMSTSFRPNIVKKAKVEGEYERYLKMRGL